MPPSITLVLQGSFYSFFNWGLLDGRGPKDSELVSTCRETRNNSAQQVRPTYSLLFCFALGLMGKFRCRTSALCRGGWPKGQPTQGSTLHSNINETPSKMKLQGSTSHSLQERNSFEIETAGTKTYSTRQTGEGGWA